MKYFYKGRRLSDVLSEKNLDPKFVYRRIMRGWTVEDAVDVPRFESRHSNGKPKETLFFQKDIENFIASEINDCYEDLDEKRQINFRIRAIEAARFLCNLDKTLIFGDVLRQIRVAFIKEGWR